MKYWWGKTQYRADHAESKVKGKPYEKQMGKTQRKSKAYKTSNAEHVENQMQNK
jgi:hypothetical protein